jgi:DNA-binding response OmpR family regulator
MKLKPLTMLFVDDDENRWVEFLRRQPPNHDNINIWAKNYRSAIAYLHETNFDVIWLDHDLAASDNMEGYDVVQEICERNLQLQTTFIIHSMNPVASQRMKSLLDDYYREAYRVPGAWRHYKITVNGRVALDNTVR